MNENKIKKITKKYVFYILAFAIPFLVLTIIFLKHKVFTQNTILQSDLKNQYIAFFTYLKSLIKGQDSIYSFSNSLRR